MDGRPNCRNKAAFSNVSCVAWTLPKCQIRPEKKKKKERNIKVD